MSTVVITYLTYLAISIGLTAWVARTLFRNGHTFLIDAFRGDQHLAGSVNRLLVVGFYLINFGYITLNLRISREVLDMREAIEVLSMQVGFVLLVLGGMHFLNLYIFSRIRRRRTLEEMPPPLEPSEHLRKAEVEFCKGENPATAA